MIRGHQIDIVSPLLLQAQKNGCQPVRADLGARTPEGDLPVLTVDAAERAAAEKDSAGACLRADAGLLPEMQGCPGDPDLISGMDVLLPTDSARDLGLFRPQEGHFTQYAYLNLHWGHFYRQIVTNILEGSMQYGKESDQALNFWWGLSAGVLELHVAGAVPPSTRRLVDVMQDLITKRAFDPFSGVIYSQNGIVQKSPAGGLTPAQIAGMDWLVSNVIGELR